MIKEFEFRNKLSVNSFEKNLAPDTWFQMPIV
jgi:hypothetical protein